MTLTRISELPPINHKGHRKLRHLLKSQISFVDNHFSTSMQSKQTAKKKSLIFLSVSAAQTHLHPPRQNKHQNQTNLRHHDLFYLSPSSLPSNPKFPHSTVIHRSFSWKLITTFPQHHPHHLRNHAANHPPQLQTRNLHLQPPHPRRHRRRRRRVDCHCVFVVCGRGYGF